MVYLLNQASFFNYWNVLTLCQLITFIFLFVSSLYGIDKTLDEYVAQAAEKNSSIKAAFQNWQSALSKVAYSNSLPDPKITYGHFIESVETRVGPQKFRLGLTQIIPWIGKLSSRKDTSNQQVLLAEQELNFAYIKLALELRVAFLDYFFILQSIIIQKDYISLTKILEQTAQSQVKVGGSSADVIQTQMEINRLKYELITFNEQKQVAISKINMILNIPELIELPLPSDIKKYVEIPEQDLVRLSKEDLELKNPQLKITKAKQLIQEARQKLVHKNRYPDVTLGVNWVKTDKSLTPTSGSGKDPVVAFVSLNLPIWRGSYRAQENEVKAQVNRSYYEYKQQNYHLLSQQEKIIYKFSDAKRRIELFQDLLIPEAKQVLSILGDAYKTGNSDFDRLQNAETVLLNLQLKLERARSDIGIAVAEYQAMKGEF